MIPWLLPGSACTSFLVHPLSFTMPLWYPAQSRFSRTENLLCSYKYPTPKLESWLWIRVGSVLCWKFSNVDDLHRFWNGGVPLSWEPKSLWCILRTARTFKATLPKLKPLCCLCICTHPQPVFPSASHSLSSLVTFISKHLDVQARLSLALHHTQDPPPNPWSSLVDLSI